MKSKIKTVIFDLDGTLSDSAILTMNSFKKIAPEFGLPVPTEEAIRRATGYAIPEFYYILFPGFNEELVYKAGLLIEQEELRILPEHSGELLFSGIRELLENLKKKEVRLCVASTGEKNHVLAVLNETGVIDLFNSLSYGRPDKKEMLREIIAGESKDECIMVGDMKKDYEAARANGILSAGALYGYCIRELADFDYYIETPLDLLNILKLGE
jgi:phosphoglycolate phosphatase